MKNGLGFGWINGIGNFFKESEACAKYISDMAGGCNIFAVHNANYGFPLNIYECIKNLYGFVATAPVQELHKQWMAFLSTSDKPFLQFCHSQGAIHVRNALMSFPKELRERIIVVGIAPAAYISQSICKECYHYVSENDIVPKFDFFGRVAYSANIHVLKPHPDASFFDHEFQSETYRTDIQKHIKIYIKTYGNK